jgi:hypothetical protein
MVIGRVSTPTGEPVPDAVLTLADLGGRQADRTRSDGDGRYRLVPPSGGTFLLICAAEAFQPVASMVVLAGVTVRRDVTLAGAGSIMGVVLGAGDGAPVASATVALTDARGEVVAATVTSSDGTYHFGDLSAGGYTLTASGSGHQPAARALSLGTGAAHRLDLQLVAGCELTGVVRVAASGQGHPGANVTLVDAGGAVAGIVATDAEGGFRLHDLALGTYTLIASGYGPVARRVEIRGGPAEAVDVLLGPAPGGHGADRRRGGQPVDNGAQAGVFGEPVAGVQVAQE